MEFCGGRCDSLVGGLKLIERIKILAMLAGPGKDLAPGGGAKREAKKL